MFRDRVFMMTVIVSALFHLSMVTLFSIYVWVPVNRPKYAQLEIKYLDPGRRVLAAMDMSLHMPTFDGQLPERGADLPLPASAELTIGTPAPLTTSLPEIALPTLDSKLLERSEMIASRLRVRSAFERETPQDSWARFIGRIGKLDDQLRELTSLESIFPDAVEPERPALIAEPAEGLAMYVEWTGAPRQRKLVLGAPIDSLWRLDAKRMSTPLTLPFKINALGDVIYVFPVPANDEMLTSVAEALRRFRFAPLDDPAAGDQIGTLIIAPKAAP